MYFDGFRCAILRFIFLFLISMQLPCKSNAFSNGKDNCAVSLPLTLCHSYKTKSWYKHCTYTMIPISFSTYSN